MAANTIITASHLAMAGITDPGLVAMLSGLTVHDAADLYLVSFQLSIVNAAVLRGTVIDYQLDGQIVKTNVEQAKYMVAFLHSMKSTGGGLAIPVRFA